MDVNTVNSLCSDSSAWRGWVQEADPPKTPWGRSSSLYLTVTEGEPRSGDGGTLGHRMLVALGVPMPLPLPGISVIASDQTSPEIK